MYAGKADMAVVKDVKKSVQIPVVANGDVCSGDDALRVLSETGADGVMVGRAAIGNPFVFSEIVAAASGKEYVLPTLSERVEAALFQLSLAIEEKGGAVAVREARKQIALYLRSFRGAAQIRAEINKAQTYLEVERALCSALE
jgi:tRNA-dihydrouridine synthase